MQNSVQIFQNNQFGEIRAIIQNNEPWFVAKDVCEMLDIDTTQTRRLTDKQKGLHTIQTPGGAQQMVIVNEAGLYKLIFTSRKPEAEKFTEWVTSDVLPTIRKHGIYATDNVIDQILNNPDFGIELLQTLKEERAKRLEAEHTNHILMHVNKTYTTTEIAKELGLKSANALNARLAEKRIQYKQNNTWVLYSNYANKGYVDIKQEVLDSGRVIYHRRWTQLGREFLVKLFTPAMKEVI